MVPMTLKPKDVAERLEIKPYRVSILAQDLENHNCYKFDTTPLGSFLFHEKDVEILKQYMESLIFFKKKKEAIQMLKFQLDSQKTDTSKEEIKKYMKNARFV